MYVPRPHQHPEGFGGAVLGCCGRRNLWRMAQALCHKFWKSDVGGTCACSWLVRCRSALLSAITRTGAIKTVRELVAFWHARPEALAPRRSRREPHRFGPLCEYRIRGRGSAPVALFGGSPRSIKLKSVPFATGSKWQACSAYARWKLLTVLSPRTKFLIDARR